MHAALLLDVAADAAPDRLALGPRADGLTFAGAAQAGAPRGGVADVAVFGIPDEEFGESLAAHVQPAPEVRLGPEAIRAFLGRPPAATSDRHIRSTRLRLREFRRQIII